MAQQGVDLDRDQFRCSLCLDLLKDPVTIACGHSYCMGCITDCWDHGDQTGIYKCPQCRETFTPRPALKKNNMLAEVMEQLMKTGPQDAPPDHCYAGPADVACDFCTGRKRKALEFCLVCRTSFCETHLQPHHTVPPLKKHKRVKASTQLQENICSRHDRILDVFCRTDQQCICYLCSMDEHKGHDTVSAAAERTERQKELGMSQQKLHQRVQEREKQLKEAQQDVDYLNRSADKAVGDSGRVFTELIRSLETRRSELEKVIRARQRTTVIQAEEVQKRLEQEIADLRRRDTELEQLSHTEDHIHFLQSHPPLSSPSESTDSSSISVLPLLYFADVTRVMSELRDKLQDVLEEQWPRISTTVNAVINVLLLPEPKTRADFLQYSSQFTLDPNTTHRKLSLSEDNRKATWMQQAQTQSYPDDHPERFIGCAQVLGREGLTGRCYSEVKWSGAVSVAASYKDMSRTGTEEDCEFGFNSKSWALVYRQSDYLFSHNNKHIAVPGPRSSRIGVYLDHRAGTLSFYSVSDRTDTMILLHRVNTTFTQPLYPGLGVSFSISGLDPGKAEFCELK